MFMENVHRMDNFTFTILHRTKGELNNYNHFVAKKMFISFKVRILVESIGLFRAPLRLGEISNGV